MEIYYLGQLLGKTVNTNRGNLIVKDTFSDTITFDISKSCWRNLIPCSCCCPCVSSRFTVYRPDETTRVAVFYKKKHAVVREAKHSRKWWHCVCCTNPVSYADFGIKFMTDVPDCNSALTVIERYLLLGASFAVVCESL